MGRAPLVDHGLPAILVQSAYLLIEQKINNHEGLDALDRAELQASITRCYGTLTTFNLLFREESHRFRGTGGAGD